MFMRRRRPLLAAAMIGGAGYMAAKHGDRVAGRQGDQGPRLEQLDMVDKLRQLSELKKSGALSADEFVAAKRKLLAG
jgi:Short C-terminal domain